MKFYKNSDNVVYAYESDGSQDSFVLPGLTPITDEEMQALRSPPLTAEQNKAACISALQVEMERQATALHYDNLLSACSYAAQPTGAPFQSQGAAFVAWRSAVWSQAYAYLARVDAGDVAMPTPEEAVAMMPALVLPA